MRSSTLLLVVGTATLFLLLLATAASAQHQYSCAAVGQLIIDGEIHPDGIEIIDTHFANCTSVTVKHTLTPYIHFTDVQQEGGGMSGNTSRIDIFSNVFQVNGSVSIPAVNGMSAPVAFGGPLADLFTIMIYDNIVNLTLQQASAFAVFASTVSTNKNGKGLHVGGNTWVPASSAAGGGDFYFLYFHGAVGPSVGSWGIQLCHNNVTILVSDAGGHNVKAELIHFSSVVAGAPVTLWTNYVHIEAKNTFLFSPGLITYAGAVTSPDVGTMAAASPFLLSVTSNTVLFRGTPRPGFSYTISAFVTFSEAATGFTGATNAAFPQADWILLKGNTLEVGLEADEVIFEALLFSGAATISKINVTDNTFLSKFNVKTLSQAYFMSFSGAVSTTRQQQATGGASSTIALVNNVWYETTAGTGATANARWVHMEGAASESVSLDSIAFIGNTRRGIMNTTGAGEISVLWFNVETQAGQAPRAVGIGSVELLDNSNFPVVSGPSTQIYIAFQKIEASITTRLYLHNNFEGSNVVNSTAVFSYFAAQRLTVSGTVVVSYNSIDATRHSCFPAGQQVPNFCPGSPPQNPMALHASIFTINTNDVSFSNTVTFSWNSIKLQSSIAVDGASTASSSSVSSILFPSGVSFIFVESILVSFTADGASSLEMNDNTIDLFFAAPTQQQAASSTTTLNSRAPIAALRVVDPRAGGSVVFGFSAKAITLVRTAIKATCAPCTASTVIFDVSPTGTIRANSIVVEKSLVALTAPPNMDAALLPQLYAVFGSVLSFCLPPAGSAAYNCSAAVPGQIGPLGTPTMAISVDNSTASFGGQPSVGGLPTSAFHVALVAAANNSFGAAVVFSIKSHNWFLYQGFSSVFGSAWFNQLALAGVSAVFTAGGGPGLVPVVYDPAMKISADCANFLGANSSSWNNLNSLFVLAGLSGQFTSVCVPTTLAPPTTSSTTLPPTTSTNATTTTMPLGPTTTASSTTAAQIQTTTAATGVSSSSAAPVASTTSSSVSPPPATTTSAVETTATMMSSSSAATTTTSSAAPVSTTTTTSTPAPTTPVPQQTAAPPSPGTTRSPSPPSTAAPTTTMPNSTNSSSGSSSGGAAAASSDKGLLGVGTGPGIAIIVGGAVFVAAIVGSMWWKFGRNGGSGSSASNTHLLDSEDRKGAYRKSQSYLEDAAAPEKSEMEVTSPDLFRHTQDEA